MTHGEILEIGKLMSDLFALVTTLDTGMIGLIIAVVEKVFTPERVFTSIWNKLLFALSIILPILSLLFSILALITIRSNVAALLQGSTSTELVNSTYFYISFFSFFIGITLFVFLALKVVFSTSIVKKKKKYNLAKTKWNRN